MHVNTTRGGQTWDERQNRSFYFDMQCTNCNVRDLFFFIFFDCTDFVANVSILKIFGFNLFFFFLHSPTLVNEVNYFDLTKTFF